MALDLTGTAIVYNATGQFGQCTNSGSATRANIIPSTGSFTVSGWLRAPSVPTVVKVAIGSVECFWIGVSATGIITLSYGNGGTAVNIASGVSIGASVWHHVEWDYDATTGGKFYVDGALVGSSATLMAAAGAVYTANFELRLFGSSYPWSGDVDEVAVWNAVQNTAAFTAPTAAIANTATGLIALYHLDNDLLDSAAAVAAATAVTLTGPTSGTVSVASTNFTVGANGTITGTVIVTPSDAANGGTFTPTTVSISSGTPTGTFTYTPASTGAKTISVTNNGSLTNPTAISYAVLKYTLVDTTDTVTAQNIRVLVPNANAAIPYNSAVATGVILYSHGIGEDQTGLLTDTLKTGCVDALLDAGYILAGTNAHGMNFGSQIAVDDYAALALYVANNYNVKGFALWSQSMGGLSGLMAITQNKIPTLVGWLGTYPMCSLSANYGTTGGQDFTTDINAAYGITGTGIATYANKTYGQNPILKNAVAFRHLPMRWYASPSDVTVIKTQHTDPMLAILAGSCRENALVACTGLHGDPSHFVPSDYVAFFNRCFATPVAGSGMLGAVQPQTTKVISITLQTKSGAIQANLTGLNWKWSDAHNVVIDSGTGATTDASGVFSVTVHTGLATAATGFLDIDNSTGTVNATDFGFSGPVAVP